MNLYYFTFRSVTSATAAGRLLREAGISNSMSRTPTQLRQQGCGYSIRVKSADGTRAMVILRDTAYKGLYTKGENGEWLQLEGGSSRSG